MKSGIQLIGPQLRVDLLDAGSGGEMVSELAQPPNAPAIQPTV